MDPIVIWKVPKEKLESVRELIRQWEKGQVELIALAKECGYTELEEAVKAMSITPTLIHGVCTEEDLKKADEQRQRLADAYKKTFGENITAGREQS